MRVSQAMAFTQTTVVAADQLSISNTAIEHCLLFIYINNDWSDFWYYSRFCGISYQLSFTLVDVNNCSLRTTALCPLERMNAGVLASILPDAAAVDTDSKHYQYYYGYEAG